MQSALLRHAALISLAFCGACLTGLLAQIRIPLPTTPVPITGQVLAVLLCAALLGGNYGMLSQVMYYALGAMGFKWFAGGTFGTAVLTGVTGGYIVGFIVAAFFLGACTRHFKMAATFGGMVAFMLMAVALIYFFGVFQYMLVMRLSPAQAIAGGAWPFIAFDVIKALIAASIVMPIMRLRKGAPQKA